MYTFKKQPQLQQTACGWLIPTEQQAVHIFSKLINLVNLLKQFVKFSNPLISDLICIREEYYTHHSSGYPSPDESFLKRVWDYLLIYIVYNRSRGPWTASPALVNVKGTSNFMEKRKVCLHTFTFLAQKGFVSSSSLLPYHIDGSTRGTPYTPRYIQLSCEVPFLN